MLDAVTVHEQIVEKSSSGGHDSLIRTQYIAPSDEYGNPRHDPHARNDIDRARYIKTFLDTRYPVGYGFSWATRFSSQEGLARIAIPILMGVNNWYVVNLRTTPLDEGILRGAGELLERYGLSRTRFNLGAFLDAREKHSALVLPWRTVPG